MKSGHEALLKLELARDVMRPTDPIENLHNFKQITYKCLPTFDLGTVGNFLRV